MCLTINKEKHPKFKPLVAESDMYVFKYLRKFSSNTSEYYFTSPFYTNFMWELHKQNPVIDLEPHISRSVGSVDEGYHAYITSEDYFNKEIMSECIMMIPKSTKYYLGICGDIVAGQMIFISYNSNEFLITNQWSKIPLKRFEEYL